MCGRASLTKNQKELEDRFGASFYSEDIERYKPIPNYNITPMAYLPVITNEERHHFKIYRWGLIPFWSKDPKIASKLINARAETIAKKNSFKGSLQRRRCLIPLDGFYEWKKINKIKQPYRIVRNDKGIFSVAGLWDTWVDKNKQTINTFTIITVPANDVVKKLHTRMPAILFEDEENIWIDNDITPKDALKLLKPFPNELMYAYPVSTKVNNIRNNSPDLVDEVAENTIKQGRLF